jgi:hypothetical protein
VKCTPKTNGKIQCSLCTVGVVNKAAEFNLLLLDDTGHVQYVDRLCYMSDVTGDDGGIEQAAMARVRCACSNSWS